MNKEKKNIITLLGLLTLVIMIFLHNKEVKENIILGTELWLTKVFPSLLPMFIISELLIAYQFPDFMAKCFTYPFQKFFHTTPYGAFAFFMSLIAGTPSSAYILKQLVEEKKITEDDASYLLTFTFFSNPLFLITMLSILFPNHPKYIIGIILIHYLTNLIIGRIFRPKHITYQSFQINFKNNNLGSLLSKAIKNSINTLLLILGTICFYLMITSFLKTTNETINTLIKGILELTQGLNSLTTFYGPLQTKAYYAIFFISFGGLSIHTQIQSIISDTKISYLPFLKGRILHVILSLLLLFITTSIGIIS